MFGCGVFEFSMDDIARPPGIVFFVQFFQYSVCPSGNDLLSIFVAE